MRRAALLCLLFAPAARAEPATVADLVRQLGHNRFAVREAAEAELLRRGEAIVPDLDKAVVGADAETAERVRKVRTALVGYRDDIMRLLARVPNVSNVRPVAIGDDLHQLLVNHQPRAADLLLSLVTDPKHPLHRRAITAFLHTWPSATAAQLDRFVRTRIELKAEHRPKLPAGADATIPMSVGVHGGWTAWFETQEAPQPFLVPPDYVPPPHFKMTARTTRYLDGKPYEAPYAHKEPFGIVGHFRPGKLSPGKHTIHAVLEYEFTHKGEKRTGSVRSDDSTFVVLPADTPDDLVAPRSDALIKQVRTAFRLEEIDRPARRTDDPADPNGPWGPQTIWMVGDRAGGVHGPVWRLTKPVDVDLCFEVEIHDLATGKVYPADPMVYQEGDGSATRFVIPRDARAFAGDRDGFVTVKVVFKPSRALALSNPGVKSYYPEPIESGELRMRVFKSFDPPRLLRMTNDQ